MASLDWIGKRAVENHDKKVPFKLLRKVKSASVGNSQNLIVHGDNLEALKALMPHYVGKIKCIYIDPPYNTGNEGWIYNDNVNSPKIRQWIGKVVGAEGEDLTRHDKWLSMLYPRLKLLRNLLRSDGVIFVSADDNEIHHLRILMNDIFGEDCFVSSLIWTTKNAARGVPPTTMLMDNHEYILCYAKTNSLTKFKGLPRDENDFSNPDNDPRGLWRSESIRATGNQDNFFVIVDPKTEGQFRGNWAFSQQKIEEMIKDGLILFPKDKNGTPRQKKFINSYRNENKAMVSYLGWFSTENSTKELMDLFNNKKVFDFPKPRQLIQFLLNQSTSEDDIILDSFAGSGTTGHAVLDLNKEDGGNRKFILVEMEDKIAKDITAERVKRAIAKYGYKDGFEFCELGKPLFDENGQIEESCDFKQFATYIYFTETQTNIDPAKIDGSYIGESGTTEYYLVFKGINKNILNKSFLKHLKKTNTKKVVYADRCTLDDNLLAEYNIVFKQIPYEVTLY